MLLLVLMRLMKMLYLATRYYMQIFTCVLEILMEYILLFPSGYKHLLMKLVDLVSQLAENA